MRNQLSKFKALNIAVRQILIALFVVFAGFTTVVVIEIVEFVKVADGTNLIASETIPRSGGTIFVSNSGQELKGLTITVPQDSYLEEVEFNVGEEDSTTIDFISIFNPITPLIVIDNGGEYASKAMSVSIPIEIDTSTEFAMAFFYNEETNELEAIPTESLTNNEIVIETYHFSSIVVSSIQRSELDKLVEGSNVVDSGYVPGIDDWQFVNYGSSLAPEGHCAGQTLTSAYYYITKTKNGADHLQGLFDNDTEGFWLDDSDAYRYASIIQDSIDFTSAEYLGYIDYGIDADSNAYYQFIYAIYITGNPQFLAIYSHDNGVIVSGHALLVYKIDDQKVYVADPNYSGQVNRFIEFDSNIGFGLYNSGDNAYDIDTYGTTSYDTFSFLGLSALVDFDYLELQYNLLLDGTIGQYSMPTLDVEYMSFYSPINLSRQWINVNPFFQLLDDFTNQYPDEYKHRLLISSTVDELDVVFTVYKDNEVYIANIVPNLEGYIVTDIPMEFGVNHYGILVQKIINGYLYYADYQDFSFEYFGIPPILDDIQDVTQEITGKYYFNYTSMPEVHQIANHYIELKNDGTFVEEYIETGTLSTLNGTWTVEEVSVNNFELLLNIDSTITRYEIGSDYQRLIYYGDSFEFIFIK